MDSETTGPRSQAVWTKPPRPDWVAKVNAEGQYLDIAGIVPLDPESLIKTAIQNTGLTDFGSPDWKEPFEAYCNGVERDGQLNLMGRIMTRSDLLMLLEGRLKVEQAYKDHPEIENQEVVAPILIVGQGRSGTSAMLNLLAEDPHNAVTRTWQALFPGLPPEGEDDSRAIKLADERMRMWARVTPEMDSIHEFNADVPCESIQVECLSFQSPAWQAIFGQTTALFEYLAPRNMVHAVAYEKRLLKLLQWRFGKTRWVLKSPDALNYLPDVLKVYPDLKLVWMHRDPFKALSSAVSLCGTLVYGRSDMDLAPGSFDTVTDPFTCSKMLNRPIDWMEAGVFDKANLCSVRYPDFIADPMHEVARIYETFGLELTEEGRAAMQGYMDKFPRSSRPKHKYNRADDTVPPREREAFKRYQTYFNVANEG